MGFDLHQTYLVVTMIASTGIALNSLEWIRLSRHLEYGGLMSRQGGVLPRERARGSSMMLDPPGFTVILFIRLASALMALVQGSQGSISAGLLWIIFVLNLLTNHRLEGISGAAETIGLMVIFACAVYFSGAPSDTLAHAGLWFVGIQTCIAYLSNGVVKARSPLWRSGDFVYHLFHGSRFRKDRIGRFLGRHRWISRGLCWITIVGECLFPIVFFVGDEWRIAILVLGFCFHLSVGVLMGLNNFFWLFVSTYPCFMFLGRH